MLLKLGETMKQYRVYSHSNGHIEFIKTGFSWPAFFFTWIWAFTKKLWWVASLGLVVAFIVGNMYLLYNVNFILTEFFLPEPDEGWDYYMTVRDTYQSLGTNAYYFRILLGFFTIWYEFFMHSVSAIFYFILNESSDLFNIVIMNLCVLTAFILYRVFMGLKGSELRQLNLIRNGYKWIDSVQADSVDQATRVYLNKIEK